jgi:myo-inositol-1(or 4)-monophosphatase
MTPRPEFDKMIEATKRAGRNLIADFHQIRSIARPPDKARAFLSRSDALAAETLREALRTARPDFGILIEGAPGVEGAGQGRWIVDPPDGLPISRAGFRTRRWPSRLKRAARS